MMNVSKIKHAELRYLAIQGTTLAIRSLAQAELDGRSEAKAGPLPRASQKALKLLALNDSKIIGKLKQDARDAQKREREVKEILQANCNSRSTMNNCYHRARAVDGRCGIVKCTLRNCPLLKELK
jgi:hypothetical protein